MPSLTLPSKSAASHGRLASRARTASALLGALLALVALAACDDDDDDDDATGPGPIFVVRDADDDFVASYVGPTGADLDLRRAEVTFDGTNFLFTSTSGGAIGTTPDALFVWGIDRGQGIAVFGDLATGVHFDAVVIAQADGTGQVVDLTAAPPAAAPLPAGSVVVSGNDLRITVPAALLPSKGFSPQRYTANLWSRVGMDNNNEIADFAPDNSNLQIRSTQ